MHADPDRDFFLPAAMDWAAVRWAAPPDGRAHRLAAAVSREAAYCHLLFRAGKHAAVLARLRAVCEQVLGTRPPARPTGAAPDGAAVLAVAADLFHRLRVAADSAALHHVA